MTVYPGQIDNDRTILRIDDNISELGTDCLNQLRDAVFAIEKTLGINPQGSKSTLESRISVSINADGTINSEALTSVGLVTLPIHDNQVADNAGIKEIKLDLDYSTADLYAQIVAMNLQLIAVTELAQMTNTDLLIHISGGQKLSNNTTLARHVASHIDLNAVPTDSRDVYTWIGLLDKDGHALAATQVAEALLEINDTLVDHQNSVSEAHPAIAITVDADDFRFLPSDLENVQEALDYIDNQETISTGIDRAILNSNGIPKTARVQDLNIDDFNINLIPSTKVRAYLAEPSHLAPRDSSSNGDDVIRFIPDNTGYLFDTKFAHVKVGDILKINYGNGIEGMFPIKSIRFMPGLDWTVRINTNNLVSASADGYEGYASIDKSRFDNNTWGVYAAAGAFPDVIPDGSNFVNSVILGSPRGAVAVGLGFDPNKLIGTHYNLYLRLYVNGDPSHAYYDLPAIDVTGNLGTTPGKYSLDRVVEETNKQFRKAGYNYRFIAFAQNGEFGVMLADHYNGAAFSIITGEVSGATVIEGSYTNNVIGDSTDGYDALGLGGTRAGFASPVVSGSYGSAQAAANYPTLVISPVRGRNSYINGSRKDELAKPDLYQGDGYWNAEITDVVIDYVYNTKSVSYTVGLDLKAEELMPGKTLVVQPFDMSNTSVEGYGRFIISDVSITCACDGPGQTIITVINAVHGLGDPIGATPGVGTNVKIYFSEDSVPFNITNLVPTVGEYHRYHEVFVNEIGDSFSIERARLPKQSLTGTLLDTQASGWRMRNVSSKFVGERVGSGQVADFRYFTRFIVTNYNNTTGEFDGYLASPTNPGGTNNGPITRGKKDFPIRFYDNTYVNFIDIEFREDSTSPGSMILPADSLSRYVDIEIFHSLRNNNEHFAVAGISHDDVSYQSITDLREFGTLSEENFTSSAISFIESGERYLHANGVVRGFKYKRVGTARSILEFSGGLALVNGSFVAVDALNVKLPEVYTDSTNIIEFFICVTEDGQLKAVIKDLGEQFFRADEDYFVESLSFKEIVDKRKDLTIIARVSAQIENSEGTIAYVLQEVADARRFVFNQDINTFSLSIAEEEDGYNSSFKSASALMNWVNEYGINEVQVQYVKIDIPTTLSFTKEVVLIGGIYAISVDSGLVFASGNWKIKDAKVFYYPGDAYYTHLFNIFNTEYSKAAIAIVVSSDVSNFGIENTEFWSSEYQRTPYIGCYSESAIFNNCKFIGNKFTDAGQSTHCLAYAFVNTNAASSTTATFSNIIVENNIASNNQGILISAAAYPEEGTAGEFLALNKVNIDNFAIRNNTFGMIGFLVSGGKLTIQNNTAEVILDGITATMHPDTVTYGLDIRGTHGYSSEHFIENNSCSYLKIETTAGVNQLKTIVSKNIITRNTDVFIDRLIPLYETISNKQALTLVSNSFDISTLVCSNNIIDGLSSGYLYSLYSEGGATISGNIINNISTDGYGIFNWGFHPDQPSTITGNTLHKRDETNISYFISANSDAAVFDNNMSHFILTRETYDGYDGYDGYGFGTDYYYQFNYIVGASFAASNINQVCYVEDPYCLANSALIFNETPDGATDPNITIEENDRTNLFTRTQNEGLARVQCDPSRLLWSWEGSSITNDGKIGVIIPISSVIPKKTAVLQIVFPIVVYGAWQVNDSSLPGTTHNNAYPEIVLEINGNRMDSQDISSISGTNFNLTYRTEAVYTGERPSAPQNISAIIKVKMGSYSETLLPGCWLGPIGLGSIHVFTPRIHYLY